MRRRRDAARERLEAERAAAEAQRDQIQRNTTGLETERNERIAADANIGQQVQASRTQLDEMGSHLASLQQQHDALAATAMRNAYTHETHTAARGGGPPMVDNGGFYRRPRFEIGLEGGGAGYAQGALNTTLQAGGAWGVRAGVALSTWLGFEARYFGAYNHVNDQTVTTALLVSGGSAVARLTAPIPYIHPYAFGGIGVYNQTIIGDQSANNPVIAVNSRNDAVVPVGGGIEVPFSPNFSIAAEGAYHTFLHLAATDTEHSNLWSASGLLKFSM